MALNILFINSIKIYGGGEIWMITAAKELINRGHNLAIICRPDSQLRNFSEQSGIDTIPLRIGGDFDPITIYKFAGIFRRNKIDIVLTNMDKELRLSGIASKISGKGKVVARHGIDLPLKNKLHYRYTYNYLTDIIVANSEATKNNLIRNAPWLNPKRIKVIYNGINPENFNENNTRNLRNELGIPGDLPLIGFVGRLSIQKGIEHLLNGFRDIRKIIDAHLLIAGEGELENEIRNFISQNNLRDSVHLTGFRNDINNIMRTIDLLVLPSLWEGFGIVLIEAMAAGKPCVTTQISSMPEIVKNNVSGIIIKPEDSNALADACLKIISDKNLMFKMGMEGKRIVNDNFTLQEMMNNYEKVFYELLK